MSEEIKPALSAEEWALDRIPAGPFELERATGTLKFYQGGDDVDFLVQPKAAHEMATVLLHGQAFGFTWEDVDALRRVADGDTWGGTDTATLPGLAVRIASLLPPRPGG